MLSHWARLKDRATVLCVKLKQKYKHTIPIMLNHSMLYGVAEIATAK
jgi:hypothetical protein